jgi:hypothetical protein
MLGSSLASRLGFQAGSHPASHQLSLDLIPGLVLVLSLYAQFLKKSKIN